MTNIYTKEMCDTGELPSVGMECMIWFSSSSYKGTITYMGNGVGCYRSKDNDKEYSFSIVSVKFKAIDTRTDEEKVIDDIVDSIDDIEDNAESRLSVSSSELAINIYKFIKSGKIHGVTWSKS